MGFNVKNHHYKHFKLLTMSFTNILKIDVLLTNIVVVEYYQMHLSHDISNSFTSV